MNIRYLVIGLIIAVIALVIIMSRPFQSTVVEEDPGQPSPHAIDQCPAAAGLQPGPRR